MIYTLLRDVRNGLIIVRATRFRSGGSRLMAIMGFAVAFATGDEAFAAYFYMPTAVVEFVLGR